MTDLEKFLKECDPDNGGDYSHDDVSKLLAMVRLQNKALASYCCRCDVATQNKDVKFGGCKACETMQELDKIARGE